MASSRRTTRSGSTFRRDVLDNRRRLINSEARIEAEVEALLKSLAPRWRRELIRLSKSTTGSRKVNATRLRNARARAHLLASIDKHTAASMRAARKVLRSRAVETFRRESLRHTEFLQGVTVKVNTTTGISLVGVNRRAMAEAIRGEVPGASLTRAFSKVSKRVAKEMRAQLAEAIANGWTVDDLAEKWSSLGRGPYATAIREAKNLARTALMASSNNASLSLYKSNPRVVERVQWEATFDNRTCFRAGTLVTTDRGDIPIEQVRQGDTVLTHKMRWRRVVDTTNRRFTGDMVRFSGAGSGFVSTWDHPVWFTGAGWLPACDGVGKQFVQVVRLDSRFRQTSYAVPPLFDSNGFSPVSFGDTGLRVPVVAIRFNNQSCRWDVEIDNPSANSELLAELNTNESQRLCDSYFQRRSRCAAHIAPSRAVPRGRAGAFPIGDTTCLALERVSGSSATLRTMNRPFASMRCSLTTVEPCNQAPTSSAFRFGSLPPHLGAFWAMNKPVRHRSGYAELVAATLATVESSVEGDVARSRAESRLGVPSSTTNRPTAMVAGLFSIRPCHVDTVTRFRSSEVVHCLVVDEDESFVANGVVVHNCPTCGSLHGKQFAPNEAPAMPAHFGCRCIWLPVFADASVEQTFDRRAYIDNAGNTRFRRQDRRFETWLRTQPNSEQRRYFGSTLKFRAYQTGRIKFDDVVRLDGTLVSDSEVAAAIGDVKFVAKYRPDLIGKSVVKPLVVAKSLAAPLPASNRGKVTVARRVRGG